ncbi:TetR/AcrR family transcriptional regulator [Halopolyspora algeriensis]|uniref:TetR/AcrR family transcriptional regulator n=1 Tax=Halopolyspora algeriensis TaxID=1500506 RepID=UPI000DF45B3C|nr:TetR family transcriptional regulator [Halopolyspora algeriensis]
MIRSSNKRDELLRRIVVYLETHGIADLSLSPMATELGTSKRMLLYYFGSRENLTHEAIAVSRPHVADLFGSAEDIAALREAATRLWQAITVGAQQRPIRILFQLLSLAPTQPEQYHALADEAVHAMVDPLAKVYRNLGVAELDAQAKATLLISGLRGLCQDRMITGDIERTDTAAHLLIRTATTLP